MGLFGEKKIRLKSKKTSEEKEFLLRECRTEDVDHIIECVVEEYDDTYYRRDFYDRNSLIRIMENKEIYLFAAFCGEEMCGIQSFISHIANDDIIEGATQIFKKKFRGFGLPYELVKFTYSEAVKIGANAIYANTVVFHNLTQKMCEDVGMTPVAFNFGSHLTSGMHNSFKLGRSEKYAQAILAFPMKKMNVEKLYVLPEYEKVIKELYGYFGLEVELQSGTESFIKSQEAILNNEKTTYTIIENNREKSIVFAVKKIGNDIEKIVKKVIDEHKERMWTIQLKLPVGSLVAIEACKRLKDLGFYFVGIRPFVKGGEHIYMQYTSDVKFYTEEFVLTDRFAYLLSEILDLK